MNLSAIPTVVRVVAVKRDCNHKWIDSFSIQTTYGLPLESLKWFSPVFLRV